MWQAYYYFTITLYFYYYLVQLIFQKYGKWKVLFYCYILQIPISLTHTQTVLNYELFVLGSRKLLNLKSWKSNLAAITHDCTTAHLETEILIPTNNFVMSETANDVIAFDFISELGRSKSSERSRERSQNER